MAKLTRTFFKRDVLVVAPDLLGKILVRRFPDGTEFRSAITEVEAYRGGEDKACHANKGRTPRTEVMFGEAGLIYVYLIYGMYWLLNIVTGEVDEPSAVLIRATEAVSGPGRIGRSLQLDNSFKARDITLDSDLWIEEGPALEFVEATPRIGIDYAGPEWAFKPWRWIGSRNYTS
ncbi:MAG: DNA-3-methyladenine glycosylase [Fibrobacterales bacterium]